MSENTKKKLIITENQYDTILTYLAENHKQLINENQRELILGSAYIISKAMGKSLSSFNDVVANKAISKPNIMSLIKKTFEDETKLKSLSDEFENIGMADPMASLSNNAHKVVDTYNELSQANGFDDYLDVDVINLLKGLIPKSKS